MERHPSQRLESRWLDDQSLGTPRFRELSLEAGHRATFTVSVGMPTASCSTLYSSFLAHKIILSLHQIAAVVR